MVAHIMPEPLMLLVLSALAMGPTAVHAAGSSGCGTTAPASVEEQTSQTIQSSGGERSYMYWLPPNYSSDTPSPLIVSIHGAGGTSEGQADIDALIESEFNTDHILVYPQSITTESNERLWDVSPEVSVDDVAYILDVLDEVLSMVCVEETRIYATGMSQGGGMVNMLACDADASSRFAAYAPVSGSYYYEQDDNGDCNPDSASLPCASPRDRTPIMAFHGGNDDVISYTGGSRRGGCLPDIEYWAEQWAVRNGLDASGMRTEDFASEGAEKYIYGDSDNDSLVTLVYDGDDVGHDWPIDYNNPDDSSQGPSATFNASSEIMDFFALYQLEEPEPTPTASPTPEPTQTEGDNSASRPVGMVGVPAIVMLLLSLF